MSNYRESNTVQAVKNNYYFAKAAINAVEAPTPFLKTIKQAGIAFASAAIGLANLPITILKDEIQPDALIRKALKYEFNQLKDIAHSKDIPVSEKISTIALGLAMYSAVDAVALPMSLIAAPLQGIAGENVFP